MLKIIVDITIMDHVLIFTLLSILKNIFYIGKFGGGSLLLASILESVGVSATLPGK